MSWRSFIQSDNGSILVILFFMATIIFSTMTKLLFAYFRNEKYNTADHKVLGGLAVLIVAVIADDPWIYFLSLFIAGLLIASERFMVLLAAIFNSDRANVHRIPSYLQGDQKLFDEQELAEAIEESTEEIKTNDESVKKTTGPKKLNAKREESIKVQASEHAKQYIAKIADVEKKVLRILDSRASFRYQLKDNVSVRSDNRTIKYDAIYVEQETNRIKGAFETKYFQTMNPVNVKAYLSNRATRYISAEFKVVFILVFSAYDHDNLDQILNDIQVFEKTHQNAYVAVYQDEGRLMLTSLYETSLKKAFPTDYESLGF